MTATALHDDAAWWWDALRRGELRIPQCTTCDATWFPVTGRCPNCGADTVGSIPAPPTATLYSYVTTHRDFGAGLPLPYTVVVADFGDSIKMFGALAEQDASRLTCGMTLEPVIEAAAADQPVLGFRLADANGVRR